MKHFIKDMLSSESGVSSSRIYAGFALMSIVVIGLCSLFLEKIADPKIYDALTWAFGFCVGGATASKFAEAKAEPKNETVETPQ